MTVLVLGNSHVSALYGPWAVLQKDGRAPEAQFVISRTYGKEPLRIRDAEGAEHVFPEITTVEPEILDISAYEGIVLVGLRVMLADVLSFRRTHRTFAEPQASGVAPITEEFWFTAAQSILRQSHAVSVYERLAPLVSIPMVLATTPLPTELARQMTTPVAMDFRSVDEGGEGERYAERWNRLQDWFESEYLPLVRQDPKTVIDGVFTRREFGRAQDGDNPNEAFQAMDALHMNGVYGAVQVPHMIEALSAIAPGTGGENS